MTIPVALRGHGGLVQQFVGVLELLENADEPNGCLCLDLFLAGNLTSHVVQELFFCADARAVLLLLPLAFDNLGDGLVECLLLTIAAHEPEARDAQVVQHDTLASLHHGFHLGQLCDLAEGPVGDSLTSGFAEVLVELHVGLLDDRVVEQVAAVADAADTHEVLEGERRQRLGTLSAEVQAQHAAEVLGLGERGDGKEEHEPVDDRDELLVFLHGLDGVHVGVGQRGHQRAVLEHLLAVAVVAVLQEVVESLQELNTGVEVLTQVHQVGIEDGTLDLAAHLVVLAPVCPVRLTEELVFGDLGGQSDGEQAHAFGATLDLLGDGGLASARISVGQHVSTPKHGVLDPVDQWVTSDEAQAQCGEERLDAPDTRLHIIPAFLRDGSIKLETCQCGLCHYSSLFWRDTTGP